VRLCLAVAVALSAGCTQQAGSWTGIFQADSLFGAKSCTAAAASPPDGQTVAVPMQVGNDGGWCGIAATRGGAALDSYLLVKAPAHGRVFAHRVGNTTRIDYTPDAGFAGADTFAVRLLPGGAVVQGVVTVAK
jgi:hypothetical protein